MKTELRKRAFNLIAPLTFDEGVTNSLLECLKHLKSNETMEKLEHIITKAEYQEKVLFEDKCCLPIDEFQRLAERHLDYFITQDMQNLKVTNFLICLQKELKANHRLDYVNPDLMVLEYDLFKFLNQEELCPQKAGFYNRVLTIIVLYGEGNFFVHDSDVEKFIIRMEKSEIALKS